MAGSDRFEANGLPLAVAGYRIEWRNSRPVMVLLDDAGQPIRLRMTRVNAATGEAMLCWEGPLEAPAVPAESGVAGPVTVG